jgi:hypothetical protein
MNNSPPPSRKASLTLREKAPLLALTLLGLLILFSGLLFVTVSTTKVASVELRRDRWAQNIVNTSNAALAAGLKFADPGADLIKTIQNIRAGAKVTDPKSEWFGKTFQFADPNLSDEEMRAVAKSLRLQEDGALDYVPGKQF